MIPGIRETAYVADPSLASSGSSPPVSLSLGPKDGA
jgi:hypothetical protein